MFWKCAEESKLNLAKRNVPFFDYPKLFELDRNLILSALEDVGSRGAFIMQKDLIDFEINLAKFTNSDFSVGVGNATDGLELAWLSVGLKKGDEVIISSHTMLATASAIVTAGGVPVPVEIGNDGLIDPAAVSTAITKNTVGISPTHLNGRTCNMDKLMQIAEKHSLVVVEDAAQALGSTFRGKHSGTFGIAGSISFFPAKVLGALGDAGAVITSNQETFDKIYQLHDHGRDKDGRVKSWGRNSRLDNLQAAILNRKFKNYSDVITRRRDIARIYEAELGQLEQIVLPPSPDSGDHFDVYQNYEIVAYKRDKLKSYLLENGVGTLIQWSGKAVHQWEGLGFNIKLPKVESFFEKCLMLPMNYFISNDDVLYICSIVKDFYAKEG
jgi:dTDP-4-amino-4,6-dideoxygalactose transaminase